MNLTRIKTFSIMIVFFIGFFGCDEKSFDVGRDTLLVVNDNNLVQKTAAEELKNYFQRNYDLALAIEPEEKASGSQILLGTANSSKKIKNLLQKGILKLPPVDRNGEGFQIKNSGSNLIIAGRGDQGVLHGIFFLEELIEEHGMEILTGLDTIRTPFFVERTAGLAGSFGGSQLVPENFDEEVYARWLVKHSINFNGTHKGGANISGNVAERYGLGIYSGGSSNFFGAIYGEPDIEQINRFKTLDPGSIVRSEPNPHNKRTSPVLCIHTKLGKEQHEKRIREMLTEQKQIKRLIFTFGDWGSICGPGCPRCGKYPFWKRIVNWMEEIDEIAKKINPEVKVVCRTWYSEEAVIDSIITYTPKEIIVRQKEPASIALDSALGYTLHQDNHSDIMIMKYGLSETYGKIFLNGGRKRGDNFSAATGAGDTGEAVDPVLGFSNPWTSAKKIRRLAKNNITNFATWWGGMHYWVYSPNQEVIKEMIWDPFQNIDVMIARIARRDFGTQAAPEILKVWRLKEKAMNEWEYLNWQQQFEQFTGRSNGLFFMPLNPEMIKTSHWSKKMEPNVDLLLPSQRKALTILKDAVDQARRVNQMDLREDTQKRAKQQYTWLRIYTSIFETQLNVMEVISKMKKDPNFRINGTMTAIFTAELQNCKNMISAIKDVEQENFRISNRDDEVGKMINIERIEDKIEAMELEMQSW